MVGRIELKYGIDWRQRELILRRWRPYLVAAPFTNEYAAYPIMSLYYDSPSLLFFDEKLEGEMLRNKVRLRGYGYRWSELAPVFLEIKRKISDRVLKYRKKYPRFEARLFQPEAWDLESGRVDLESGSSSQAVSEGSGDSGVGKGTELSKKDRRDIAQLALLLNRYRLRPAVQILYQREAYESPFFPSLRIAFDSQLVALHPGQEVTAETLGSQQYRITSDLEYVFEIKSDGGLPSWVMHGIREAQVTQKAISKYCLGIQKLDLQNREIGVYA